MNGDIYYMINSAVSFDMGIVGLVAVVLLFLLMVRYKDFVLSLFTCILSLVSGVYFVGYDWFSIGWWIGLCLILFSIYVLFIGLYYVFSGEYSSHFGGRK